MLSFFKFCIIFWNCPLFNGRKILVALGLQRSCREYYIIFWLPTTHVSVPQIRTGGELVTFADTTKKCITNKRLIRQYILNLFIDLIKLLIAWSKCLKHKTGLLVWYFQIEKINIPSLMFFTIILHILFIIHRHFVYYLSHIIITHACCAE